MKMIRYKVAAKDYINDREDSIYFRSFQGAYEYAKTYTRISAAHSAVISLEYVF